MNAAPLHEVAVKGVLKVAAGLTITVKITGGPVHPFAEGVTVICAFIGSVVPFVVVNAGILLPVPPADNPIAGLLFDQVKVVPGTGPERFMSEDKTPVQSDRSERRLTVGIG